MTNQSSRTTRRNKKMKTKKTFLKRFIMTIFILMLIVGVSIAALFTYYIAKSPELDPEKLSDPFSSEIYDMNGEFVTDIGGSEKRIKIKYDDLPDDLINAVIATEDSRFFDHPGIDIKRIFGAIRANIQHGFGSEGASTITQQVVENAFLTPDKTIELKVQEQWLALKLEREYSKEQILEMYLNKIFYGSNAYGVAKASEIYFGKTDLHDLTLVESAMLAGLPQRPTAYNPYENPDLMAGRVDTVLKLMVRHGKISQTQADEARGIDISSTLSGKRPAARVHDGFIQQVEKEVEEKLDGADINTEGLKIYTTLNKKAQKHVEFLLTNGADNPVSYPDGDLQAGLSVVDNETGAVRAIGGSRNSENLDGMNYAIDLERQAGSTMKPIAAYGPAIEYESWSTYHQINDETFFPKGSKNEVRNYDRRHHGWMSMRHALATSYNVPAAKTLEEIGSQRVREFGTSIGINYADEHLDARDAIGGTATNVTPFELAGAYSAFANNGIYTEPYTITKVEFADGTTVDLTPESETVMKDSTAYMITDMLRTAIKDGTGVNANIPGLDVVGKTGTTNLADKAGANNAWFSGYTTKYTIAVWTGYDKNNDIVHDTQVPLALFKHTMSEISKDIDTPEFKKPETVVEVNVQPGSNPPVIAGNSESGLKELFVKGTEPNTTTEIVDNFSMVTNLTAIYDEATDKINISWAHEDKDAVFEVSASINENSMKKIESTTSYSTSISPVEKESKYTIQVVAVNEVDGVKSEPRKISLKIDKETEEEIPSVTGLSSDVDTVNKSADISWGYDGPQAIFEIIVNGAIQTTSSNSFKISNLIPGTDYKITVTPISSEDNRKGPASVTNVKMEIIEEPEEPEEPKEPEKPVIPEDPEENENTEETS